MSNGNGHHWSKFCWRDWSADKALHPCSLAAKGFWIEMLCIMHEGTPIGHLTMRGKPATVRQMAANACCTEKEAKKCLAELEDAGVFSRTPDGTIFCRRMVKDAVLSETGRGHAQKRWDTTRSTSPPNGGPIGVPNREPTGEAIGQPTGDPNAKKSETDSDLEVEKKSVPSYRKPLPPRDLVGSRARVDDALSALMAEVGIEEPERKVDPELVKAHVNRTIKACEMRIPYAEVRSRSDQIDAILCDIPPVVEGGAFHWQPVDPERTPAEQLAAILSISLAEAQARLPVP